MTAFQRHASLLVVDDDVHMMMDGTNNLEVADVILNWIDRNVPAKTKSGKQKS